MYFTLFVSISNNTPDESRKEIQSNIDRILKDFEFVKPAECNYLIDCNKGDCRSFILNEFRKLNIDFPNCMEFIASPYYIPNQITGFAGVSKQMSAINQIAAF